MRSESDGLTTPGNALARTVAVLVVLAAGLTMALPGVSNAGWSTLDVPFIHRDVLFVYLLSALPTAWLLVGRVHRITSRVRIIGRTLVLMAITGAVMIGISRFAPTPAMPFAGLGRAVLAVLLALSLVLAVVTVSGQRLHGNDQSGRWMSAGVAGLMLLALPVLYVEARSRHDANQLMELISQMRFGEASRAAAQLQKLNPMVSLPNQQPLTELVGQLEAAMHELEVRVAAPLPPASTRPARLERAQALAMLGRTDEALLLLRTFPDSDPAMNNLCATILENSGAWQKARDRYSRARAGWQSAAPSEERFAGIMQACQGLGYCERKLGHIAVAEAAYLELLALAPTAENHFLLAQFYEDTQQSLQAYSHARRAIDLAPRQFHDRGEKLFDKLVTSHFGCLSTALESRNIGPRVDRYRAIAVDQKRGERSPF